MERTYDRHGKDLDDIIRMFRLDVGHDYRSAEVKEGRTVAIRFLGVYEKPLEAIRAMLGRGYRVRELRHGAGGWVRVDIEELGIMV